MLSCSKTNLGDQGKEEEGGGKQRLEAAFIRRLRLQKVSEMSQNPPVVPESNLRMEAAEMRLCCKKFTRCDSGEEGGLAKSV